MTTDIESQQNFSNDLMLLQMNENMKEMMKNIERMKENNLYESKNLSGKVNDMIHNENRTQKFMARFNARTTVLLFCLFCLCFSIFILNDDRAMKAKLPILSGVMYIIVIIASACFSCIFIDSL